MSIIISPNMVLGGVPTNPLDTPFIGQHSLVAINNGVPTSADAAHPISNLANQQTFNYWQATSAVQQELVYTLNSVDPIDYVGIAGHNLGSAQCPVSVYGYTEFVGSSLQPDWQLLCPDAMLGDDKPAVFRFSPQGLVGIKLRIGAGLAVPRVAVMHIGKLLVFERGIHATDMVPMPFATEFTSEQGLSHTGQYLGEIISGRTQRSSIGFRHLRNQWVRESLVPFLAQRRAFFLAWAPQYAPTDLAFCWHRGTPKPAFDWTVATWSVEFALEGFAL